MEDLSAYTRKERRANSRRVQIDNFDLPRRGFYVFLLTLLPAVGLGFVVYSTFSGVLGLNVVGTVFGVAVAGGLIAAAEYAAHAKSRAGLPKWRDMVDRRGNVAGWCLGDTPISMPSHEIVETQSIWSKHWHPL